MNKFFIYLLVFLYISITNFSFATEIATSFQYPISPEDGLYQNNQKNAQYRGWLVAQDFQDCRKEVVPSGIKECRHLGEDWNYFDGSNYNSGSRAIHAVANGYIVASGNRKGFAGYIIMKHYLSNGTYVLSIYGHLQTKNLPQANSYFKKGQYLASTASSTEMKEWTTFGPHLHFEIRKSKAITGFNDNYLNDGYDYSKGRYYDPTDVWDAGMDHWSDYNSDNGFLESHFEPIEVYDFLQSKSNSTYPASCNEGDIIIDAQFKVKNISNNSMYINLALAVHKLDGSHLFDMGLLDFERLLEPNESLSLPKSSAWVMNLGQYELVAKAYYDNKWHKLDSQSFSVVANNNCLSGSSDLETISNAVFDDLESNYSHWFPPTQLSRTQGEYYYRSYSNGSYLLEFNGVLWYKIESSKWNEWGDITDWKL